ncbi:MAG: hypothetical protein ACE5JN_14995 [Candidatus Methylomirabilia bacterium]
MKKRIGLVAILFIVLAAGSPFAQEKSSPRPPANLERFKDSYSGFTLLRPKGWKVEVLPNVGVIQVIQDKSGKVGAFVWPLFLSGRLNRSPEQLLGELVSLLQAMVPGFRTTRAFISRGTKFASARIRFPAPGYRYEVDGLLTCIKVANSVLIGGYWAPAGELPAKELTLLSTVKSFRAYKPPVPTRLVPVGTYTLRLPRGWRVEPIDERQFTVYGDVPGVGVGVYGFGPFWESPLIARQMPPPYNIAARYVGPVRFLTSLAPRIIPGFSRVRILSTVPQSGIDMQLLALAGIPNARAMNVEMVYTYKGIRTRGSFLVTTVPPNPALGGTGYSSWIASMVGGAAPVERYQDYEGVMSSVINSVKVNWKLVDRLNQLEVKMRQAEIESTTRIGQRWGEALGGLERLYDPKTGQLGLGPTGPLGTRPYTADGINITWATRPPTENHHELQVR